MQSRTLPDPAMARDVSITERLRTDTRRDHDAIEANPRMARLMARDLTLAEYAAILGRLRGFYVPVEHGLRRWAAHFPAALEIEARLGKAALLDRDLADIGVALTERAGDPRGAFGEFRSLEAAWGCLYVIEGSSLGGQIIARHLRSVIALPQGRGTAFHTPHGTLTGARWQTFKACLTEEVAYRALNADAVVAGARATFAALDGWMAGES